MKKKIVIIGGGAAGMLAAIAASENRETEVAIFEKNEKLGKKLYITGKGRCNITNACEEVQTLIDNTVENPRFLYSSFYSFTNHDMIKLLEENGLETKVERGNRVFPASDKSSDVIKTLSHILKKRALKVQLNSEVEGLIIKDDKACGINLKNGENIEADAVIVATGGLSYPSTGSTGDGYSFARAAGHRIIDQSPSLVPLTIKEEWCRELSGLSLKNISFSLMSEGKEIYREFGELMFTHFGITGPVVLSASSIYSSVSKQRKSPAENRLGRKGKTSNEDSEIKSPGTVKAVIDLKPALSHQQLDSRVLRDFEENKNRQIANAVKKLMPASLIPVILAQAAIDPHKVVRDISREERNSLVSALKALTMTVTGRRGYSEAVITRGGIDVRQIKPDTMESKLVSGLYFAGEVIDVDALTGGYNLQIAWSTGWVAGKAAGDVV